MDNYMYSSVVQFLLPSMSKDLSPHHTLHSYYLCTPHVLLVCFMPPPPPISSHLGPKFTILVPLKESTVQALKWIKDVWHVISAEIFVSKSYSNIYSFISHLNHRWSEFESVQSKFTEEKKPKIPLLSRDFPELQNTRSSESILDVCHQKFSLFL